jgi:hypothetical protein
MFSYAFKNLFISGISFIGSFFSSLIMLSFNFNFTHSDRILLLTLLKHGRILLLLALFHLLLPRTPLPLLTLLLLPPTPLLTRLRPFHLLDLLLPLLPLLDIHLQSLVKAQPALPLILSDLIRFFCDPRLEELLPFLFLLLLDLLDFLLSLLIPFCLLADVLVQGHFRWSSRARKAFGLERAVFELFCDSFLFELPLFVLDVLEFHRDDEFTSVLNSLPVLVRLSIILIDLRIPNLLQVLPLLLNLKILQVLLPLLEKFLLSFIK